MEKYTPINIRSRTMDKWIADIVVCLAFYFVYHRFYIKHCKQQWIEEISQKVAERLEKRKKK